MQERKYNDAKKEIRSVLLTYQSSITLEEFLKTYKSLLGERLPSRALGYHTDVQFLQSMPDVVNVCTDPHGKVLLSGIADQSSEHIQKLVSKQRKPPKNNKSSSHRQRMPNKSHSYKEMTFLPANMRAEILKLMQMYHDGVTFSTFALTYRRRFNKYLPLVRGFDSLEDMINLIPELEVKTVNNERLICFANSHQQKIPTTKENMYRSSHQAKSPEQKKITQSGASSSIHKSGISDDILQNFKQLLEKFPEGIIDINFPPTYEDLFQKNFDVLELGFNSIIELVDSLPHIFKRVLSPDNDKNWIILPVNSPVKDCKDESKSPPMIPHQVLLRARQGIPADAASPTLQYMPPVMPQNLDLNEFIPVFVSAIINPSLFWFQLQTEDIVKEFEQFEKDLGYFYDNHVSSRYVMSDADIAIGATCVVRNTEDSQWYRAVIKSIPDVNIVNVLFVDYGSRQNVPRANLHYVRSKYHEYPAHAFKAQLAGLKPSNNASSWSLKAQNRFIQLCKCITLMAYLTSVDKDTYSAYLCDTSGESDIHFNDVLNKEGFGEFCFENQFLVDNNASYIHKEAYRSDSDCYFSSDSVKQDQNISEKEQNNSFVTSEVSHAKRKLIFSPKAQINGIEPKFSSKENGQTSRRFVKLVQLCEDSKIHIINIENRLFTSCADLSRLLWNDRDSSYLIERLKYKEVDIKFFKVAKDEYSSLFEQCIWFKIPEYEKLEASDSFLIMYPLDCALQILNAFGHPSICLRLAIQNEIKNFDPSDPLWKEFNCDKLEDLSEIEKEIMEELKNLCLYDLKAKYEALKIKRIKQERMQNSPNSVEMKTIDNLQRVIERRMKEIEAICLQFSSPS